MNNSNTIKEYPMRDHYDFAGGVRGKFAKRYQKGTNVITLDPDVLKVFPNALVVNQVLRELMHIGKTSVRLAQAKKRAQPKKVVKPKWWRECTIRSLFTGWGYDPVDP